MKAATLLAAVCAILLALSASGASVPRSLEPWISRFGPAPHTFGKIFTPPPHRESVEAVAAAEMVAKCKQGLDNKYSHEYCGGSNYDAKKCCSYRSGFVKVCSKTPYYPALQTLLKTTCS